MTPSDSHRRTRPWPRVEVVQTGSSRYRCSAANAAAYERALRRSRTVRLGGGVAGLVAAIVIGLILLAAGLLGVGR